MKPAAVVAALVVLVLAMDQASYESHLKLRLAPVASQIEKIIPKGACVATDQTSYLLMANRFSPDLSKCPHMLDGLGSDLGFSNGLKPSTGAGKVPAVQAMWSGRVHQGPVRLAVVQPGPPGRLVPAAEGLLQGQLRAGLQAWLARHALGPQGRAHRLTRTDRRRGAQRC